MIGQAVGSLLSGIGTIATSVIDVGASVATGLGAIANLTFSTVGLDSVGNFIGNVLTPGGAPYAKGFNSTVKNFDFSPDAVTGEYSPFSLSTKFDVGMDRLFGAGKKPEVAPSDLVVGVSPPSAETDILPDSAAAVGASSTRPSAEPIEPIGQPAVIKPPENIYRTTYNDRYPSNENDLDAVRSASPIELADAAEERVYNGRELAYELAAGDEALQTRLADLETRAVSSSLRELDSARLAYDAAPDSPLARRKLESAAARTAAAANEYEYVFEPAKAREGAGAASTALDSKLAEVEAVAALVSPAKLAGPANPLLDGVPQRKIRRARELKEYGDQLQASHPDQALLFYREASGLIEDAETAVAAIGRDTYKDNFGVYNRLGKKIGWDWESITPWLSIATTFGLAYMQNEKQEKVDEKNRRYMDEVREDEQAFQREMQGQRLDAQMAMAGMAASAASPASVGRARPQTIGGGTASA